MITFLVCLNPLRIGEVFPTNYLSAGQTVILSAVSIPFASGKSFQPASRFNAFIALFGVSIPFSIPFASGKSFQQEECIKWDVKHLWSQSPSHRGILLNKKDLQGTRVGNTVSIPFASGNTFERRRVPEGKYAVLKSQSPSHRGILLNPC